MGPPSRYVFRCEKLLQLVGYSIIRITNHSSVHLEWVMVINVVDALLYTDNGILICDDFYLVTKCTW